MGAKYKPEAFGSICCQGLDLASVDYGYFQHWSAYLDEDDLLQRAYI
jgi:hypothetical protein